jgi:hypothetical protein
MNVCPSIIEGAGNAGCALHPRSRVQSCAKKRTRAYRFSGNTPASPAQWLYGRPRRCETRRDCPTSDLVAQDGTSEVVGVVLVTPTALQGIALLYGLFVDPAHWKRGIRHSSRLAKRPAMTTMSKSVKRLRRRASRSGMDREASPKRSCPCRACRSRGRRQAGRGWQFRPYRYR